MTTRNDLPSFPVKKTGFRRALWHGWLLVALLVSCGGSSKILDEATLIEILIEIHQAESKINSTGMTGDRKTEAFLLYEQHIYAKYQTDSLTFHRSHDHYIKDLGKISAIYKAVADSLSQRKERLISNP